MDDKEYLEAVNEVIAMVDPNNLYHWDGFEPNVDTFADIYIAATNHMSEDTRR